MIVEVKGVALTILRAGAQSLGTLLLVWFFDSAGPIEKWAWTHYVCAVFSVFQYIKFLIFTHNWR